MSFQQGLSGLNSSSKNLEVIGNNIANAGTYGSKSSRAEFADVYANSVGGSGNVGIGVRVANIAQQFSQGSLVSTSNSMDVAINGDGFFQLKSSSGDLLYSRNGQFKVDNQGFVVNGQNQRVQGYGVDPQGAIQTGVRTDLQFPTGGLDPKETGKISMALNLDSRSKVTMPTPTVPATDSIKLDDATTYNNATSVQAYDAKGQPATVEFYFQKSAAATVGSKDQWNIYAAVGGKVLGDAIPAKPIIEGLTFDSAGLHPKLSDGTALGSITLPDIPMDTSHAAIAGIKFDMSDVTQFGTGFTISESSQNGNAPGQLTGLTIDADGVINARYSNGLTRGAGQLELASFRNAQGLRAVGGNAWMGTPESGAALSGAPGSGTLGVLQSGALEESNVDMTGELVNMITAQRLYQANAQTIKAQDQVLQTLVNLR
ncbi:flagellar hook protein FlgE [Sphaerotilus montanus]|uniref:Flagellar hook protein FlgE n=1 Tax=Sphaerotilus montanus TaxID=522889 RepID=A0A7Y9UKJ3_9BURK|nr:flagellar hook protein FlgE [Sphaerotilus montanus]NYG33780.1 flagellar hook protein FlgE [Sphaerotilus montanus]NZD58609.1 flagellar hook protein FlgE [Sphaerotilus montanus]